MSEPILRATCRQHIQKPSNEVYDAIVNPEKMTRFFTSSCSAPLTHAQQVVKWTWGDKGVSADVEVLELEMNRRIVFSWSAAGTSSRVEIELSEEEEQEDGSKRTVVSIQETSPNWQPNQAGIDRCVGQAGGWMHFCLCMKAYLVFGINLRQ